MLVLRNRRLLLHLPSLTQTAWMLPAAPGWMGRTFGSAKLKADVGAAVAVDAVTFGSALPHSYD